jgi:hypothetical protein
LDCVVVLIVLCQDEHEGRASFRPGFLERIKKSERIQFSIKNKQVGSLGVLKQVAAAVRFSDHSKVAFRFNDAFQTLAKDGFAVDQKNAHTILQVNALCRRKVMQHTMV